MSELSFDRDIDFLDFTPPKHYNVAINVALLALFWWFGGCTFALLIHSFGAVYIAKSHDVCVKTTWKPRRHQNAGNGLQKSKFSWGHAPPPRRTRLWRVVCLWHTACLWHAKPPLTKVWIRPCYVISSVAWLPLRIPGPVSWSAGYLRTKPSPFHGRLRTFNIWHAQ